MSHFHASKWPILCIILIFSLACVPYVSPTLFDTTQIATNLITPGITYLGSSISMRNSTVCTAGLNNYGQLPFDSSDSDLTYLSHLHCEDTPNIFIHAHTSAYNTFLTDIWGNVFVSGDCFYGQCGLDVFGMEEKVTMRLVPLDPGVKIRAVCAMDQTTAIWTEYDNILTSGRNQYGQTGLGLDVGPDGKEIQYTTFRKVLIERFLNGALIDDIQCARHSVYVLSDHRIVSWGRNDMYQLGDGTQWNRYAPHQMPFFVEASISVAQIRSGEHEAYALDTEGVVWAWGRGFSGQLGYRSDFGWTDYNQVLPVRVTIDTSIPVTSIAAGDEFLLILTSDGTIHSVGQNGYGQLGFGEMGGLSLSFQHLNTTRITEPPHRVFAGLQSSFVVTDSGQVFGVGRGSYGIFGNDDLADLTSLGHLNFSFPIKKISAAHHMIAIKGEVCDEFVEDHPVVCNGHGYCGFIDNHSYCACEAGYTNQHPTIPSLVNVSCTICPKGQYAVSLDDNNSITVCEKCQLNTYSTVLGASSPSTCLACPTGFITPETGADSPDHCEPCTPGHYAHIEDDTADCRPCPQGTWSANVGNIGVDMCTKCAAGTYGPNEGQTTFDGCIACGAGLWSDAVGAVSNSTCLPCPLGTYSVLTGQDALEDCIPCPIAMYSDVSGATSCQGCPLYLVTHTPGAIGIELCDFCLPGYYSNVSTETELSSCSPCQPGTYANSTDAISPEVCKPCPAGYVTLEPGNFNITSCAPCPPSTYSHRGDATCTPCPTGTYSTEGATVCISCPPGKVLQVPLEEVTENIDENCGLCYAGSWTLILEGGVTICVPCVTGTYSTVVGAMNDTVCLKCPTGTYSELEGRNSSESCFPCPRGMWSNTLGATSFSTCIPCSPGTFSNVSGAVTPMTCVACPSGTWSSIYGAPSRESCNACPAGSFSPLTGRNDSSTCELCPPQSYSSAASSSCAACPLGHYTDPSINGGRGMQSIADCIPCPAGTHFKETNNTASCVKCPKGTFSTVIGAYSPNTCLDCPAGTYNEIEGSDTCEACARGTWSSVNASDSVMKCEACPSGYYSNTTAAFTPDTCLPCPLGTYQEHPASFICEICPSGTYSTQLASQNRTNCVSCPPGFYGPLYGATSPSDCLPCPAGTYNALPGMSSQTNCTACALGTFSPVVAASTPSTCKGCPPDSYANKTGTVECTRCLDGFLTSCENVVDSDECLSSDDVLDDISVCRPCAPGSFLTLHNGVRFCTRCPVGTYSEAIGASSNDTCLQCPPGTYTSLVSYPQGGVPSFSDCVHCPSGTFNPLSGSAGSFTCLTCPPATWSPSGSPQCRLCLPGTASSSSGAGGMDNCATCQAGTWSGEGYTSCIPCEEGYYSEYAGATNISFCLPCPIGTASDIVGSPSAQNCRACPLGYYTSDPASPKCLSCPAGSFSNETGSTACITCPEGTFSLQSSSHCSVCNVGTYSDIRGAPSRASCKLCPPGMYNPVEGATRCQPCGELNICPQGASSILPNLIFLRHDDQKILSPIPVFDQTTDTWLKWGTVIFIAVVSGIIMIFLVVCSCCSDYKEWFSLFRQGDILFNMSHETKLGFAGDKEKTRLGGLCSMLVIPAALILLTIIIADAFAFNVNLVHTFKLLESSSQENSENVEQVVTNDPSYGNYLASISVMGTFPKCAVIPRSSAAQQDGFWIEVANIQPHNSVGDSELTTHCESRERWLNENIDHCYCEVRCKKCVLMGISQTVSIGAPRQFATTVGFELVVPYFSRSAEDQTIREPFLMNGTVIADEGHIFYGIDPIQLFISVFETQYISTPNFIFKALGRSGTERRGLTSQLLTVSHGDNPLVDEQREALKDDQSGFHFTFSIALSNLAFVQEEVLLQDFVAILANISALVGAVFEIARILMTQYEKRESNYRDLKKYAGVWKQWLVKRYKSWNEPKTEKEADADGKDAAENPTDTDADTDKMTKSDESHKDTKFNLAGDPWMIADKLMDSADKEEESEMVPDDRLEDLTRYISPEMLAYMEGEKDSLERMKRNALEKERKQRNLALEDEENISSDEDDPLKPPLMHSPRAFMYGSRTPVADREARDVKYQLPESLSSAVMSFPTVPSSAILEHTTRNVSNALTIPVQGLSSPITLSMTPTRMPIREDADDSAIESNSDEEDEDTEDTDDSVE